MLLVPPARLGSSYGAVCGRAPGLQGPRCAPAAPVSVETGLRGNDELKALVADYASLARQLGRAPLERDWIFDNDKHEAPR